jgi:putative transposase
MPTTGFFFRRNLPHWQPLGATFFLTYRLAGTLSRDTLSELEKEHQRLKALPRESKYSEKEWHIHIERKMFSLWDERLDKDKNVQWLADPRIATIVRENLYHHAGAKYHLWAYVIMPNHIGMVHFLWELW